MKSRNILSILFVGIVFFVLILGCGSSQTCTGELTIDGKSYRGTDRDSEQAKRNSCSKYCIEGDPEADKLYRIWLNLPESKNVPDRESKWAAQATYEPLKKYVRECEDKCFQADRDGKQKIDVKCQ